MYHTRNQTEVFLIFVSQLIVDLYNNFEKICNTSIYLFSYKIRGVMWFRKLELQFSVGQTKSNFLFPVAMHITHMRRSKILPVSLNIIGVHFRYTICW